MTKIVQNITAFLRKMVGSKRTCIIDFSILTLLAAIVFRNWIFTKEWPAGGDITGWIARSYLFYDNKLFYIWHEQSFGFIERIYLLDIMLYALYLLTHSPIATVKIFLFLSYLMAGFSIYIFIYMYIHKRIASIASSLFYTLNHFIFSQFENGHIDIIFSYAFAPVLFTLLDYSLKKPSLKSILSLSLAMLVFLTAFHLQYVLIYGIFLLLFIIIHVLYARKPDIIISRIKNVLKVCLPTALLCLALSAFMLLPLINGVTPKYFSLRYRYDEKELLFWSYKNLTDSFTLRASEPSGYVFIVNNYNGWSLPDFPIYELMFWLLLISYCIILIHKDNYTLFFLTSTIISIFTCKGPYPPFGYLFRWAWFNIPFISVFRRPTRWGAMTAFSHSFFIALLVNKLVDYIESKRYLQDFKIRLHFKVDGKEFRDIFFESKMINSLLKKLHKIAHYLAIAFLLIILISSFILSWFFFLNGLLTYTPPKDSLSPYEWIAEQEGDFKVIAVNLSPDEWMGHMGTSDFANAYSATPLGWHLDLGYSSSFIHNKPVLQDGGWNQICRSFVDHLRFKVVRERLYSSLPQVIGAFGYKYIILPQQCKRAQYIVEYFTSQKGFSKIYEDESNVILENKYYVPSIFPTDGHIIAIGGFTTFFSLPKIESFNMHKYAIIMPRRIEGIQKLYTQFLNNSIALLLVNEDLVSFIMCYSEKAKMLYAAEFGSYSTDVQKNWIPSSFWRDNGHLVLGMETLTTCGANTAKIPFEVDSDGTYDIWMRIGFGPNRGILTITLDDNLLSKIQPNSSYWSRLIWVKVKTVDLKMGRHIIKLENDGSGYNDIDAVAIIKPEDFMSEMKSLLNSIENYPGRIIHILEAENAFIGELSSRLHIAPKLYEDYLLTFEDNYENISPEGRSSASSSGTWGDITLWPYLANDGNLATRWASKPHEQMPQWLMIEWDAPQKINGVRILFERANAVDYKVQSWNGTAWIDQAVVEGNDLLERIHMFNVTVETMKMRIYITRVTELYDLVSIWELEALTTPALPSTKIFILKDGYYRFALRLIREDEQAVPFMMVDDQTITLQQSNFTESIVWYEGEPIYLKKGEHEIRIGSLSLSGKMSLDQIIIYSLRNENEEINVNRLFEPSLYSAPHVEYEKISPCEYKVHLENSTGPSIIAFSESYHPLWRAYVDGEEIEPIPLYSMINGFYINKTGDFNIKIYFKGQDYAENGLKISGATLVLAALMLVTPWSKFKKLLKTINIPNKK